MTYKNYSYPDLNKFIVLDNLRLNECLKVIEKNENGLVFVCNKKRQLLGTITDGDIRRYLIRNKNLNCSAKKLMKKNFFSLSSNSSPEKIRSNIKRLNINRMTTTNIISINI